MVWFTHSVNNDHLLLDKLKLNTNTIYVFDKGYNDYEFFKIILLIINILDFIFIGQQCFSI